MHGTTLLSIVLLVLTGCSSSHVFTGVLNGAAPIAGTESFYVFTCDTITDNSGAHPRFALMRLEPDGSSRKIREVNGSLRMVSQLAPDTALVVERNGDKTRYLYSVATGEISPLPKDYQYGFTVQRMNRGIIDSLFKIPLLKGYDGSFIIPLYSEDCYLIGTDVPGTGGPVSETSGVFSCGGRSPDTYLLVADMKRNTLTNIGVGFLYSISPSKKHILLTDCDGRSDRSRIVSIADIVE